MDGIGVHEFSGSTSMPQSNGTMPQLKMRISIYCPDFNRYLECPEDFLPLLLGLS